MFTRASVRGHPLHPIFVSFPIALFSAGLASLIAYRIVGDVFWFRAAYAAMLAGGAVGVVAMVLGAIDVLGLPRDSREKSVGITHGALAASATLLFLAAGFMLRSAWNVRVAGAGLDSDLALILALFGFAFLVATGMLGWRLVGVHHVGVSPVPGKAAGVALPQPLTHAPRDDGAIAGAHGAHGVHG